MAFFVYILASGKNGTLYVGMTDDLGRRGYEHREKTRQGFAAKYGAGILVWFETHETREGAFIRERRIKKWRRIWRLDLIEESNPGWEDILYRLA